MIITASKLVRGHDIAGFAWSSLRRFLNVQHVEQQITDLHKLPKSQRQNARKQAQQVRYCLMQAREYAEAADRVSLVTKPTLLYYSTMCLALAEVLLKHSGDSSLDRARETHRHHGLTFHVGALPREQQDLQTTANGLLAKPAFNASERFGTFELWHRSCRFTPVPGMKTQRAGNGQTTGFSAILAPEDSRLPLVPKKGLTLMEVMKMLPSLMDHLGQYGIHADLVRTRVDQYVEAGRSTRISITINPCPDDLRQQFLNSCMFRAGDWHHVDYKEGYLGGRIDITFDETALPSFMLPNGTAVGETLFRFWPGEPPLNEFGLFYYALFIVGNYARYFPDKWIADVEENTALALAVEEMMTAATARVPLLALSELSRIYHVPAD